MVDVVPRVSGLPYSGRALDLGRSATRPPARRRRPAGPRTAARPREDRRRGVPGASHHLGGGPMNGSTWTGGPRWLGPCPTRRQFLLALGVGAVGVACTRGRTTSAPLGSIADLTQGIPQLSVLGTGADAPPMSAGRNRLGFALVDLQGRAIVGGAPQVWLATDETTRALGPTAAIWHPFT